MTWPFLRRISLSDWIAGTSALIAVVALAYTIYQAHLSRATFEAQNLPILEFSLDFVPIAQSHHCSVREIDDGPVLAFSVANVGAGLAKIDNLELLNGGTRIEKVEQLIWALFGEPESPPKWRVFTEIQNGDQHLRAGEEICLLVISFLPDSDVGPAIEHFEQNYIQQSRNPFVTSACYCSLTGRCYAISIEENSATRRQNAIQRVKKCPVVEDQLSNFMAQVRYVSTQK